MFHSLHPASILLTHACCLPACPLAGRRDGLVLLINPQWTTEGQAVSDFGILPWQRKAAEELVGSFQEVSAGACGGG